MFSKSTKLDRVLTQCIRSIEEKGWSVEDCLDRYARHRVDLEPMLRTALQLRQARSFGPSTAFRSNAQSRIRKGIQSSRRSPRMIKTSQAYTSPRKVTLTPARLRLSVSLVPLLLISLIIIGTGGGIAYAADNARPGDILFQVDRAIEQIRIGFENDLQETARLHLQFASERIEEMIQLVEGGNTKDLVFALTEYKFQISATTPLITKAQTAGEDISPLVNETSETIITHQKELKDLIQIAPIGVQAVIQVAIEDVENIRKIVLSPVPGKEPVVKSTPEPLVFEPVIPTKKGPTHPASTPFPTSIPLSVPPTTGTSVPPSTTATPGTDVTPTGIPPTGPDLVSKNLVLEPEIPEVNMVLKISGVVKNQGTLNASTFGVIFCVDSTVEACYQDQEGDLGGYLNFASLAPGVSYPVHTYSWLPDTGEEHIVHICADIGHSVSESNESASSNCTSKIFTVLDSGLIPDLTIAALDWPIEAYEDNDVIFFYRVTNAGTGTARGGYLNQLFIDGQLVPDLVTQVGTREIRAMIVPGGIDSHGFVWRATCGTHQVTARTDVNNQLSESNEGNNTTLLHNITVYCHVD